MSFTETVTAVIPKVLPPRLRDVHAKAPKKFWYQKVGKSAVGAALAGLGLWLKQDQPLYVWLSVFGFGCHTFSEDWFRSFVDFAVSIFTRLWQLLHPARPDVPK